MKKFLTCTAILVAAPIVVLILFAIFAKVYCSDREEQKAVSPDGRYEVRQVSKDSCLGATVDFISVVALRRRDGRGDEIWLLETYHVPRTVRVAWLDGRRLDIVVSGMRGVPVITQHKEQKAFDVEVSIRLDE